MPSYLTPGVYVEEVQSGARPIEGVGTAVAAFVGFAETGPFHQPTLVTNWDQYVQTFGTFTADTYLTHAVYGFFANGGGAAYIVRIGGPAQGASGATAPGAVGQAPAPVALGGFLVAAKSGTGADLSVEIADPEGENPPEDRFKLLVRQAGKVVETYDVSTRKNVKGYLVTQARDSKLVQVTEQPGTAQSRPEKQTVALAPAPASGTPGSGVARLDASEYVGDAAARTGFGGLESIDEITMVAVPDLMSAYQRGEIDAEGVKTVQLAVISHCEQMGDRVAVLDTPPGMNAQQVRNWRNDEAGYDSRYATLYYPWVKVFDPAAGRNSLVPPSGHVAGVWARSDGERGVHKAPANEVIRGAVDLEIRLSKGEQDLLNPIGVNCVRAFPGRGIRIWGARTLSSDPAWRYLNVRRLFNYLEESILLGTQWVVFEPNDDRLWSSIRRNVTAFLTEEWRRGALFGRTAEEAFYVRCDRSNNPQESIDLGQVVCEIGVAPVKPAEFVVFRLAQFSDSTSLIDE
ncbi:MULTISPECIES: phage tail sheath family protein [Streptomyces]|uniref:phage tail sheath family protein n=2 Tax=Streptomyces TaxID=1883 RepID=UPI000978DCB3|nr:MULTISPECIES: phage tail sheath family protein [Streptomyces]NDZ66848.1 phage tail sheath family protein [Streptomyces cyaneofuscatus]ONI50366.1 putative prophage major tail sheath protein [Streptomyces sp. IB2014 011-1]RDV47408.1 phage tail sheath family protein [Streptomyces sp. IB2014 011-12]CAD5942786.1 Phage tail sheath family protein [Streptomyces sp. KY70]CAD5986931.1 Phage tail sheath family protein [Streptomyces sp. KY75]